MENVNQENRTYSEVFDSETTGSTKKILPLKFVIKIVSEILDNYSGSREDLEEQSKELRAFIQEVLTQDVIPGDADDWHNLTVDIARNGYFDLACDVLEVGLSKFPRDADLLGDYLQYGINCGRIDQCKKYYKQLNKMPKVKYTWRSFHFSVNWLTYLWEQSDSENELKKLTDEMLSLASQYRTYFPKTEESYRCEADIYKLTKKYDEEEKVLQKALETHAFPAPKCALRLADLKFEEAKYDMTLQYIQRGLDDCNQVQDAISDSYLHYLAGLSRLALAQKKGDAALVAEAETIYQDFESSLLAGEDRSSLRKTMGKKAGLLQQRCNIEIPSRCRLLRELVSDMDLME